MYRISHRHAFDLDSKDMEIILGSVQYCCFDLQQLHHGSCCT
jgi:hypothetical protein